MTAAAVNGGKLKLMIVFNFRWQPARGEEAGQEEGSRRTETSQLQARGGTGDKLKQTEGQRASWQQQEEGAQAEQSEEAQAEPEQQRGKQRPE